MTDAAPSQPLAADNVFATIIKGWIQPADQLASGKSAAEVVNGNTDVVASANGSGGGDDITDLRGDESDETSDDGDDDDEDDDDTKHGSGPTAQQVLAASGVGDLTAASADYHGAGAAASAMGASEALDRAVPMEVPVEVAQWKPSGDGLHSAVTASTTSFSIEALDATGNRIRQPVAASELQRFSVTLTGASMVRARVFDEGNGSLSCEYRVMQTGKYRLSVMHAGSHLPGSPYTVVAKAGVTGLKDWKASRQREAASLRAARKARDGQRKAPPQRREPSPRINPAEQLQKAYAYAMAAIASDRRKRAAARPPVTLALVTAGATAAPPVSLPTATASAQAPGFVDGACSSAAPTSALAQPTGVTTAATSIAAPPPLALPPQDSRALEPVLEVERMQQLLEA